VLAANNLNVDVISADEDLAGYRLVIAPALIVLTDRQANNLSRYVERGGHLVLTLRTGLKDEFNALLPMRQPGPLAALAGVEVEDYYALAAPVPVQGKWLNGAATIWAERLKSVDGERTIPISVYGKSNGWLDDQLAVAVHPYGRGLAYTVGAYLDETAQQAFVEHVLSIAGVRSVKTPLGVEIRTRLGQAGSEIVFVINHTAARQTVTLPWPALDHLSGKVLQDSVQLDGYAVLVLTQTARV
jgi:beta-galactosidase